MTVQGTTCVNIGGCLVQFPSTLELEPSPLFPLKAGLHSLQEALLASSHPHWNLVCRFHFTLVFHRSNSSALHRLPLFTPSLCLRAWYSSCCMCPWLFVGAIILSNLLEQRRWWYFTFAAYKVLSKTWSHLKLRILPGLQMQDWVRLLPLKEPAIKWRLPGCPLPRPYPLSCPLWWLCLLCFHFLCSS